MIHLLHAVTDRASSKKGKWIALIAWIVIIGLLSTFAPSAKDYEVSSIDSLPDDAQSVIAQKKIEQYFEGNDGIPAILVFQSEEKLELTDMTGFIEKLETANIDGL